MKLADILHENATHYVSKNPRSGYDVWRMGSTHATHVAVFGSDGETWLARAIADADERDKREDNWPLPPSRKQ